MKSICHKSVLLVDDNARMLRALEKVLVGEGCKVICAPLVADAMDILIKQKTPIDLVITDLWMPFMTGVLTGVAMIHAIHEIFPALPVIVLTAFASPEVKSKCLRLGAAAFLEKPLNTPQLLDAVEGVLASRKVGA